MTDKQLWKTIDTSGMDATGVLLALFDVTVDSIMPSTGFLHGLAAEQRAEMDAAQAIVRSKIEDIRNQPKAIEEKLLINMGAIVRDTLEKVGITSIPIGENVDAIQLWINVEPEDDEQ